MLFKRKRDWDLPESAATDETRYLNRRRILAGLGIGGAILAAPAVFRMGGEEAPEAALPAETDPSAGLYPVQRNPAYTVERALTAEAEATTYRDSGLKAATTRHYRTIALSDAGDSEASNTASATTEALAVAWAEADISVTEGRTALVAVRWT